MIKYDRLWLTLKSRQLTQYRLCKDYDLVPSQFQRLRKNKIVTTYTIDRLCRILNCRVEDVMEYTPDESTV